MKKLGVAKVGRINNVSSIGKHYVYAKINRSINVAKIVFFPVSDSTVPSNALLNEDGTPILTEDGQYILVE